MRLKSSPISTCKQHQTAAQLAAQIVPRQQTGERAQLSRAPCAAALVRSDSKHWCCRALCRRAHQLSRALPPGHPAVVRHVGGHAGGLGDLSARRQAPWRRVEACAPIVWRPVAVRTASLAQDLQLSRVWQPCWRPWSSVAQTKRKSGQLLQLLCALRCAARQLSCEL